MTRARRLALLLLAPLLALAWALPAGGQSRGAVLIGSVRDATTGRPVDRGLVCTHLEESAALMVQHCARTDSAGSFRLDSLPAGSRSVYASCRTVALGGKILGEWTVVVPVDSIRRDWAVDTGGCDTRVVRRVAGVFSGHYTSGFESSSFVPCRADEWFLPSDSLQADHDRRAWVVWPKPEERQRLAWPEVPRGASRNPRYFVRLRGTVVGPGHYGHFGVSAFQLEVDTLLEVRAPGADDC